jgi:hypothetical protein
MQQLIGAAFIITQTAFMLLGLFFSFTGYTLFYIFDILSAIYGAFKNYFLTIIALLFIIILQKYKIRMDKFLGNVLQPMMQKYFKCCVCN